MAACLFSVGRCESSDAPAVSREDRATEPLAVINNQHHHHRAVQQVRVATSPLSYPLQSVEGRGEDEGRKPVTQHNNGSSSSGREQIELYVPYIPRC
jgi:hypothetical protein